MSKEPKVVVIIPCYNEEASIKKVLLDCQKYLPTAEHYVLDNNSSDRTAEIAVEMGATVKRVYAQGKGNVVVYAFNHIKADAYLMIDGDDTYNLEFAKEHIQQLLDEKIDMMVGTRLEAYGDRAFPRFHLFGNRMFSFCVSQVFGQKITDMLSGYRIFSREFALTVPLRATGFEIETELTVQSISKGYRIKEVSINYQSRPENSFSKLNTFRDGFRILRVLAGMFKNLNPLRFFGLASLIFGLFTLIAGSAPVMDFIEHQYVYHVPRAILATGLAVVSAVLLAIGLILQTLKQYHLESFRLNKRILIQNDQ